MQSEKNVTETLHCLGCSMSAFAGIIEISPAALSLWARGIKGVGPVAELRIREGLHAIVVLAQAAPAPIDWTRVPEIKAAIRKLGDKGAP
jgi:DNA-binding transcriptional regulator YdaS (Cro superfamily)